MAGGRAVLTLSVVWQMGGDLDPGWPLEKGYRIEIEGKPAISTRIALNQPSLPSLEPEDQLMALGMIATAMPVVNAIPDVCRAAPGVRSYIDLPLICARGLVKQV